MSIITQCPSCGTSFRVTPPQLQAQLMELELGGLVARLPGGKFQRIARA